MRANIWIQCTLKQIAKFKAYTVSAGNDRSVKPIVRIQLGKIKKTI